MRSCTPLYNYKGNCTASMRPASNHFRYLLLWTTQRSDFSVSRRTLTIYCADECVIWRGSDKSYSLFLLFSFLILNGSFSDHWVTWYCAVRRQLESTTAETGSSARLVVVTTKRHRNSPLTSRHLGHRLLYPSIWLLMLTAAARRLTTAARSSIISTSVNVIVKPSCHCFHVK